MQGWIKLHRKLLNSRMYKSLNSKQRDVMMQCLLLANHEDNEWEWGQKIFKCEPGQFITSLGNLKNKCSSDVKIQSVRTSLLKLEKWDFLTNESTKTGRLITICNWELYQDNLNCTNKDDNKELTKSQQRANKELTTNKNEKKYKNVKKYIYNEFYDLEIINSVNNENYIQFVRILFGENNSGLKLNGVLRLKNQLTWKQFQLVYTEKKKNGISLTTILENLENRPDWLKKYSLLQRVLLNWMRDNKK